MLLLVLLLSFGACLVQPHFYSGLINGESSWNGSDCPQASLEWYAFRVGTNISVVFGRQFLSFYVAY